MHKAINAYSKIKGVRFLAKGSIAAFLLLLAILYAPALAEVQPEYLSYEYPDFGVKIDYPTSWVKEEFAFDDRHFGFHPGHLPGLPFQFLQPSELDVRPQGEEIVVLGLYAPLEGEENSSTQFLVIVEKVSFGHSLQGHIDSYMRDALAKNSNGSGVRIEVLETRDSILAGGPAKVVTIEKSWMSGGQEYSNKIMRVFTVKDDRVYILQYDAPSSKYDEQLPVVNRMVDSFTITSTGLQKAIPAIAIVAAASSAATFFVLRAARKGSLFLVNMKRMLPAALGIEILCISSAEIGGNIGLYFFGYSLPGIGLSYLLVYALAGFVTFAAILGRHASSGMAACDCSILESHPGLSFASSFKATLAGFGRGLKRMVRLHKERDVGSIIKTALVILVTAESGCILTAATVDFLLYQYSLLISVPLSLFAGTIAVAVPQALKKAKMDKHKRKDAHAGHTHVHHHVPARESSEMLD